MLTPALSLTGGGYGQVLLTLEGEGVRGIRALEHTFYLRCEEKGRFKRLQCLSGKRKRFWDLRDPRVSTQ